MSDIKPVKYKARGGGEISGMWIRRTMSLRDGRVRTGSDGKKRSGVTGVVGEMGAQQVGWKLGDKWE